MNKEQLINGLNALLTRNYDSEKGYQTAKDNVENISLEAFFNQKIAQRYQFGHEIKDLLSMLGGKPDKGTSITGDLHRGWMNLKGVLSMNTAEEILEEVERGEETCLEDYDTFLRENEMPVEVRQVISRQRNYIAKTLNRIEQLEDIYDD